jgi:hypothetical protein
MKFMTILLGLALAFGPAVSAQDKKGGEAKKTAAETKSDAKKAADTKKAAAKKETVVADNERCTASTQDGDRCKRKAQDGSKLCWQHAQLQQKKGAATKAKKS